MKTRMLSLMLMLFAPACGVVSEEEDLELDQDSGLDQKTGPDASATPEPADSQSDPFNGLIDKAGLAVVPTYYYYKGNTHSHTEVTDHPSGPNGTAADHHSIAKAGAGIAYYDFYVTTDHSHEVDFADAWTATKASAAAATDSTYVGISGFEFSRNTMPNGHINVMNTSNYVSAATTTLTGFYSWLTTSATPAGGTGPIVASFNHPTLAAFDNFGHRTQALNDKITMIELISRQGQLVFEDAFVKALDLGWKVSPVHAIDNHAFVGISSSEPRTVVLAPSRSKLGILNGMKSRRTYASRDGNLEVKYTANDLIMGSTLAQPFACNFSITVRDPDTGDAAQKISRIEIVKTGGAYGTVARASTFAPTHGPITWNTSLSTGANKWFYVRVYQGSAAPGEKAAWIAPIWTGL